MRQFEYLINRNRMHFSDGNVRAAYGQVTRGRITSSVKYDAVLVRLEFGEIDTGSVLQLI